MQQSTGRGILGCIRNIIDRPPWKSHYLILFRIVGNTEYWNYWNTTSGYYLKELLAVMVNGIKEVNDQVYQRYNSLWLLLLLYLLLGQGIYCGRIFFTSLWQQNLNKLSLDSST